MCACPAKTENTDSTAGESTVSSTTAETSVSTITDETSETTTASETVEATANKESDDLLSGNALEDGLYINDKDGNAEVSESFRSTDYITVDGSKAYNFVTRNAGGGITFLYNSLKGAYYDKDKNYISGIHVETKAAVGASLNDGKYHLLLPPSCKYIRLSVNDNGTSNKWSLYEIPKTVVWFGDSIIGNMVNRTSVTEAMSNNTGMLVYNMGFSGCRMSRHDGKLDTFSMYHLAEYVRKNDFSVPVSVANKGWKTMPYYFPLYARIMSKEIDFKNVDIIIISFGTNDYKWKDSVLDNKDKRFDIKTVCGALRYSIKQIKSRYPNVTIYVTSPVYRFFRDRYGRFDGDSNTKHWGSGTLIQYSNAYRDLCKEMNVRFIDLYNLCDIKESTRDMYFPLDDSTHPNEKGRLEIANTVSKFIVEDLR